MKTEPAPVLGNVASFPQSSKGSRGVRLSHEIIRSALLIAASWTGIVLWPSVPAAKTVSLTIVHTNDVHGGIDPTDATYMSREFPPRLGGGASMATLLENVRNRVQREGGHVLLVDSGDIFQGTPIGTLTRGRAIVDFMNTMEYDAWALGNHDFDEGKENCMELVRRAKFPAIAANLRDSATKEVVPWVKPWIMKDYGDLKVAVIGLITNETVNMSFPANISGLDFAPMIPTTRKFAKEAKAAGADVVLVVGHIGIPYDPQDHYNSRQASGWPADSTDRVNAMDIAHAVDEADVYFCGHIHKGFDKAWVMPNNEAMLFQTYGRGSGAGVVTLEIDVETNQVVGKKFWTERGYLVTFFEDEFWPDPEISDVVQGEVRAAEAGMDQEIGRALGRFAREGSGETAMGNAVCEAMLEECGADFAFTNLGGIRDEIQAGVVTPRDVFRVLPFPNTLVVFRMSGVELKNVIETRVSGDHQGLYIAGGRVVVNKTRPDFDRVTNFEVGGRTWDPTATYRVCTTDFLAQGNNDLKMLTEIPDDRKTYTGKSMRQAMESWFKRHNPASPVTDGRWVRDDASLPTSDLQSALKRVPAP